MEAAQQGKSHEDFAEYLKDRIRYWEGLRESALPHVNDPNTEGRHYHDVWSTAAQVLLSALWELNGENRPIMREVLAEKQSERAEKQSERQETLPHEGDG